MLIVGFATGSCMLIVLDTKTIFVFFNFIIVEILVRSCFVLRKRNALIRRWESTAPFHKFSTYRFVS